VAPVVRELEVAVAVAPPGVLEERAGQSTHRGRGPHTLVVPVETTAVVEPYQREETAGRLAVMGRPGPPTLVTLPEVEGVVLATWVKVALEAIQLSMAMLVGGTVLAEVAVAVRIAR
jgi:hypothetical protein